MLQNRTISSRYLFFSTLLFMLIAVLGIRIVLAEENRLEAVKTDPPTAAEQVKDLWKTRKKKLQSCYFEWEREKVMSYSYLELREMQQRTTLDGGRISDEMIKLIRESYADQKVTEKQTHKLWLKGDKFRYEIEGTTIGGLKDREPHPTEVYQVYDGTVFFSFSYNPTWSPYTNAYFKKPNDHCFRYYGVEFLQDYLQIFPQEERFQQYADYRLAQQDVREETLTFNLYQYLPGEKRSVNPQFPPELRLDLERGGLILARKSFHYQGKIREQSKCEYSRDEPSGLWIPSRWEKQTQEIVGEFGTDEVSQMKKYDLNAIIPDSRFEYEVPDSAYVWYQDGSGRKQREPLVELPPLEKPK